jgi:hypothetical protein
VKKILNMAPWFAVLVTSTQLWAAENCSECVLGVWDDATLTSNFGQIVPGQPKDVYVGIKFAEGLDQLQGISFSLAVPSGVRLTWAWPVASDINWICDEGTVAPPDTSQNSLMVGGCTAIWGSCLLGNQALVRVTLLATTDITNGILRVKRQYPLDPLEMRSPTIFQCDGPQVSATRVTGGSYILNWNGDPSVGVDGAAWSMIKGLYR